MDKDKFIRKQDLYSYLNVSKREQYRFWDEVNGSDIICERNDCLYANTNIFFCGDVSKNQLKNVTDRDMSLVKIYSSPMRGMYTDLSNTTVRPLSYLFRIIPYVHSGCGICCIDPEEIDADYITPMSIGNIADAVGYCRNSAYRLLKIFLDYKIEIKNKDVQLVKYIPKNEVNDDQWGIFINQYIYRTIKNCK